MEWPVLKCVAAMVEGETTQGGRESRILCRSVVVLSVGALRGIFTDGMLLEMQVEVKGEALEWSALPRSVPIPRLYLETRNQAERRARLMGVKEGQGSGSG
jgi:hypothetical protein